MELELNQNLQQNTNLEEKQNNFLQTTLGKVINTAINAGIRYLFPNIIENQIIEIKESLINGGLKEGVNKAIEEALNLGKSAAGIVTGKFDNIEQIEIAVGKGGMIDSISKVIDNVLKKGREEGKIDNNIFKIIKNSKDIILENISTNVEDMLTNQIKTINKLEKYTDNWKKYYTEQDFSNMEKEYRKIEKEIPNIVPLENMIKEIRKIENMHLLIKNKGGDFNLSWEQIEAGKVLV